MQQEHSVCTTVAMTKGAQNAMPRHAFACSNMTEHMHAIHVRLHASDHYMYQQLYHLLPESEVEPLQYGHPWTNKTVSNPE